MAEKKQELEPKVTAAPTQATVSIDLPPGKVLIQPLKDGKEYGEPFVTSEGTARKVYSDTAKFAVKKKA